jgi:membrane protease YdiL (CAAX protease family)
MIFQLDSITDLFLAWVLLLHPAMAWRGYKRLNRRESIGPKIYRFRLTFYAILFATLIALLAAVTNQLSLGLAVSYYSVLLGLIFGVVLVASATRQPRKVDPAQQERIRLLYAPTNTKEWIWAVWIGICAGIGEEIVYRAVLFQIVVQVTSSASVALLVCVLAFAVAHLPQGIRATLAIALMGISFHILYFVSGGLAAPIVAHVTYDVVLFTIFYRREIRKSKNGILTEAEPMPPETSRLLDSSVS